MLIDRLRWLYRAWGYRYRLERQEIRALMEHLLRGQVAVDVGAHKGAYTFWMRQAVGAEGAVYAFEPQPELAERLRALVTASAYDNVVVENRGLSSTAGILQLRVPGRGDSPGASFEKASGSLEQGHSYPVSVTTLDDYFAGDRERPVSFIKCDAEGHELEVFRGGENLLRTCRPVLLFECERRHRQSDSVEEVFDYLHRLDYAGYFMTNRGAEEIARFDPAVHQPADRGPGYVNNFLFLPRDRARS
jgi:FkbM family methyltransferase